MLYQGTQSFFDEHLQGGLQALVGDIAEPELRDFISQRFLPSSWYDVLPVPALIAYEARALRMGQREYLRHRSRWQAQRDLSGIHRWILKLASPKMVARRLPKVMTQMFDFAEAEVIVPEDESMVQVHMHHIPAPLEEWLSTALVIYGDTALKLAGASFVDTELEDSTPVEERAGVELHRLTFAVRWH